MDGPGREPWIAAATLHGHPDFAFLTCLGPLRWRHGRGLFTTLGIACLSPLERIPRLELERRGHRRLPSRSSVSARSQ